jgi:ring-1,2-phenylacetyl-CoA epoxidase subunit PaaD
VSTTLTDAAATARAVAGEVADPELPMLTLADLGVLREVTVDDAGEVRVVLTPTYSGCPAMATMRDDVVRRLRSAGFRRVTVGVALAPAWSSDWISERGREALRDHGISPPGPVAAPGAGSAGAVPLTLTPTRRAIHCPRCDSADTAVTSEFGSTACKALYRCRTCLEPFDHVKEH